MEKENNTPIFAVDLNELSKVELYIHIKHIKELLTARQIKLKSLKNDITRTEMFLNNAQQYYNNKFDEHKGNKPISFDDYNFEQFNYITAKLKNIRDNENGVFYILSDEWRAEEFETIAPYYIEQVYINNKFEYFVNDEKLELINIYTKVELEQVKQLTADERANILHPVFKDILNAHKN